MFDIISDKIADGFVKTNAIKAEDKEIYQFGIQQTFVMWLCLWQLLFQSESMPVAFMLKHL